MSIPVCRAVGDGFPVPQTFPLGGRWLQKMSKSGHFLKTDEGEMKKNVPSSVKNQRFLTASPWGEAQRLRRWF